MTTASAHTVYHRENVSAVAAPNRHVSYPVMRNLQRVATVSGPWRSSGTEDRVVRAHGRSAYFFGAASRAPLLPIIDCWSIIICIMSIRFCIICIWLVRQAGTLEEARFYRTPMNSLYRCSTNT